MSKIFIGVAGNARPKEWRQHERATLEIVSDIDAQILKRRVIASVIDRKLVGKSAVILGDDVRHFNLQGKAIGKRIVCIDGDHV